MGFSGRFRAIFCAALAWPMVMGTPAKAGGINISLGQLAGSNAMLGVIQMMLASQNQCITYTYDANGNRLGVGRGTLGTATWGSSAYPCFFWGI